VTSFSRDQGRHPTSDYNKGDLLPLAHFRCALVVMLCALMVMQRALVVMQRALVVMQRALMLMLSALVHFRFD
jgi:hypothetical protein